MPKKPTGSGTRPSQSPVPASSLSIPVWKGASALKRVRALNERCLEVLTQLARTERARSPVEIVRQHRSLWLGLDAPARKRAAQSPIVLVDVHFQDLEWWRWAKESRPARKGLAARASFPTKAAGELMRETLMLAWSTAGVDRCAASLLLGMTPGVSALIAELGPQDVASRPDTHDTCSRGGWICRGSGASSRRPHARTTRTPCTNSISMASNSSEANSFRC